MRPVLCRIRNVSVPSYPALLYVGLNCGVIAGNLAAHQAGLDALRVYIATLLLIVPGLAGARLLFVSINWGWYGDHLGEIWNLRRGGYVMYGGLLFVLPFSVPLLRGLGLDFGKFWDVSSFTILTGMVFTRIGCLLNGCCAGRASTSWFSARLPNSAGVWAPRVPTQVLEAGAAMALLLSACIVWRWLPFPGALFLFVTLGYASARFVMEFAREPHPGSGTFRVAHVISILAFLVSASVLTMRWPK
jgi:phosphatidylglycerol:prolipoprotein diacylglycerol transferase